jgi:hypothetical protein
MAAFGVVVAVVVVVVVVVAAAAAVVLDYIHHTIALHFLLLLPMKLLEVLEVQVWKLNLIHLIITFNNIINTFF